MLAMETRKESRGLRSTRADWAVLLGIAGLVTLVHLLTNTRYGFHRDELQFLSDARHLAWGYVSYPPFTPFVERIGLAIFGVSLVGLRLFSVLAQAAALVVTGSMARELGGGRLAQVAATLAVVFSALPLFNGTEFQYTSFDYLWWSLIAYCVIRLLKTEDGRWWLAIGAMAGVALMTKYTSLFLVAGIVGGLLLSGPRRYFRTPWFWAGCGLTLLICLPNLVWQAQHGFISLAFTQHIHARDVRNGRAENFFLDQARICTNPFAVPIWILGLVAFFRSRQYRLLGWMYLIPLALFAFGKGRGYYLAAAYPMLLAMGAAEGERWVLSLRPAWRRTVEITYFTGLSACGLYIFALILPLASSGPLRGFALSNNGDLREEIGWDELVRTVAGIRDSLPPDQRASLGILTGNYGEQGAVEILGSRYDLPLPISMTNSAWVRGYPVPAPATLIVIGFSREDADQAFFGCRLAGHNGNAEGIRNEESKGHPDIFVCGAPRLGWPEFWKQYQNYG